MTEETLFQEVLAQAPDDRASFLQQACAGRPELRAAVEALLAAHLKIDNLLDRPAAELVHTRESDGLANSPASQTATTDYRRDAVAGVVIGGRYTLQEKIGEGGMGEVWVAKQTEPVKRKVALKLIKTGMDSRAVLQRFEQERQALALMDHPNIARVLDGGMTASGQPFFVMELVNGLPLNKFCDEAKLTPRQRLELFVPICQAVQHAHHKGIVHRDLKPANILVTLVDARPVPKVIDFGVAKATSGKLTEETMSTGFGAVVGTLEYMSPEQAGFSNVDIDTRADIYSLGVILYELLTGLRPIDAKRLKKAALNEMIRIIREEEPSKPSTRLSTDESLASSAALRHIEPRKLMALLRGDLDWVVMKCLEKQRDRRYETANGLARDIQRYLDGDGVEARPPSTSYRLRKFARKYRAALVTVGAFALFLVLATAISAGLAVWANRERGRAVAAESAAKEQQARAESREIQAIDAVKRFGDVVANEGELKNSPQLAGLRKTLLKEPLAFFKDLRERLQADADTPPESLARLAQASFDLGKLTDEIGDKQDALFAFLESLEIRQKLADGNPTDTKIQRDLATSYGNIGIVLSAIGKPGEAMQAFESARTIWQKLADANPTVTEFQSDLAGSQHNIVALLAATGKLDEAPKAYESSLAIRERLVNANPTNTRFLSDVADSHNNFGLLLTGTANPAEALKAHESALAIRQKLADANPTDSQFQSDLAGSHNNIGPLLYETGKPVEALEAFTSALAIQQKLADANPTVTEFQSNLAGSHSNIGNLLSETGEPGAALEAYKSALVIQQKVADASPTVTKFQSDLAAIHFSIGNLLSATGKPGEALQAYESAMPIQQKLADANPTATDFQSDLARSRLSIGALLVATGKQAEALAAYESAIPIQQKLADTNPTVTDFQSDLARSHLSIGALLVATGKLTEALAAYKSAMPIQQMLADSNSTDTQFQRDLADGHYDIGGLLMVTGKIGEALEAYESALAIRQKLADANPTDTKIQRDLATSYGNIRNLLVATGKQAEALEACAAALEIQQKLADDNPTVTEFQNDLADSYNNIGLLLNISEKPGEAMHAFELALPIRERLAREHPESADYACALGGLLNDMARIDIDAKRFDAARDQLQQAVVWQKKALATNPRNPIYRQFLANHLTNLIKAAQGLDDAEGTAEAERELAELRDSDPAMVALDARLSAIIKGDQQPGDNPERLALAQRAYEKALHATAARLFAEALAADAKLADDRQVQIRYNAACVASLSGCGKGKDDPAPDDGAKTLLRQQALDWLKAELATWTTLLASADQPQRAAIAQTLEHWKVDSDLGGIRDAEGLEILPEAERESWKALWTQVDELLAKATAQPDNDQL